MHLWNPATGEYKLLPAYNISRSFATIVNVVGFGYDHISGKFKVLAIKRRFYHDREGEGIVYTLGTGSWRSIREEVQYPLWELRSQVFGGCPHWILPDSKFVVSFNVGNEKFKEIPMPHFDNATTTTTVDLTALGGRLSIFSYTSSQKRYELWVKMDDGLENIWTKQISFNESDITRGINGNRGIIKPWGFRNGQVLLQNDGLALFDPVTGDVRALRLRGGPKKFHVYSYIESLAMLTIEEDGGGDVHQNDKEDNREPAPRSRA